MRDILRNLALGACRFAASITGIALLAGMACATAQAADDYYTGKTLTVMIASKPGGGTDTTGRLVARFWGDHIPGKPQILVRNKPLEVLGANDLQTRVHPDGLTVGVFAGGGTLGPVIRQSHSVRFNLRQWEYVGSIDRGPSVQLIRKSALARLNDPSKPPIAMGTVSTDRTQDAIAAFGAMYLGWNLKFIPGYPNSNAIYLAYGRGEVDMFGSGTDKILDRFTKDEGAVPLVVEKARADFPGVPVFSDLLTKKGITKEQWAGFRQWNASGAVDKYFALPPKTPKARVEILQKSFMATTDEAAFKKEANNVLGGGYVPIDGPKTGELIVEAIDSNPAAVGLIKKIRAKLGLPQMQVASAPKLVKVTLEVQKEGRVLLFKSGGKKMKLKVSGSRSEITVGGKLSPRSALKTGMTCQVGWAKKGKGLEARQVVCP